MLFLSLLPKMRIFNIDGSEGKMAGNSIRCLGKYLYDNDMVKKDNMTIETASGIKELQLFTRSGKVSSVTVNFNFTLENKIAVA